MDGSAILDQTGMLVGLVQAAFTDEVGIAVRIAPQVNKIRALINSACISFLN
ncbi:MAG: hypothetical protein ACI9Y1_003357 [Lentisphaeria bacterium]|jgi:hypothetical protein